ncbi:hypothetical protein [Rhodococcus sp. 1168]|uniref:VG15 protein n=1 Tax=Rhodococcus sp. 1168 TaxID=2018041 RepID=UPI000A0DFEF7|nr:hypothetical protein [Rhodococcus sp. 1168]ORI13441.1 hypothetical protein BJI47_22620 [Rhodococcus sp. 1168]
MPTPDEQKQILDDLHTLAMQDVTDLWQDASMLNIDSPAFRGVMTSGVPELLDPYAASAGDLAATWYEDAAPELAYKANPAALAPTEQIAASTAWALQASGEAALMKIAGFSSRTIYDQARNTIVENADREPGAKWARYASADACAFCRMLASRAEVYSSKAAATSVVGRGREMSASDRAARARGESRGGRGRFLAGGSRTRGSRDLGTRYHDHCRCRAISVRPGQTYLPPDHAKDWDEQYAAAVRATSTGGAINLKAVLSKMDELDGGRAASRVPTKTKLLAGAEKATAAAAKVDAAPAALAARTPVAGVDAASVGRARKAQIEDAEFNLEYAIKESGRTREDLIGTANGGLTQFAEGKQVALNLREDAFDGFLADGRYKTQFETGTGTMFDPANRATYEQAWFGMDSPAPIYGYLRDPSGKRSGADAYGRIALVLKDDVRSGVTVSVGDSMGRMDYTVPGKLGSPGPFTGSPAKASGFGSADEWAAELNGRHYERQYVEAQIQREVRSSDVAEVVFRDEPSADLIRRLNEAGLPFSVVKLEKLSKRGGG